MARRTRKNPLNPTNLIPSTGNPQIDEMVKGGIQRAVGMALDRVHPAVKQFATTIYAGMEEASAPVLAAPRVTTISNPIGGTASGKHGDKARFVQELIDLDGGLLITLGKRGSGKTAFDLKIAQLYHDARNRPVFVIGMPPRALAPFSFKAISPDDLDDLPNNAVVVIDDVALFFSNRDYAKAGLLHKLIIESRHRHVILVINAHNSALVDKYTLECNVLFLKPSSSLTADLQRGGIRTVVERADAAFAKIPRETRKRYIYAYSDELEFEGLLQTTPPRGWSQAVSEHHAGGHN